MAIKALDENTHTPLNALIAPVFRIQPRYSDGRRYQVNVLRHVRFCQKAGSDTGPRRPKDPIASSVLRLLPHLVRFVVLSVSKRQNLESCSQT